MITFELPEISASQPQDAPEAQVTSEITATVPAVQAAPAPRKAAKTRPRGIAESGRSAASVLAAPSARRVSRVPRCRVANQTTKGSAIAAVAFSETATAMIATPATNRRSSAATRPRLTSPTISDSLCMPPTMCSTSTGLATPSQVDSAGSAPSRAAMRGTAHRIAAMPATDTSL